MHDFVNNRDGSALDVVVLVDICSGYFDETEKQEIRSTTDFKVGRKELAKARVEEGAEEGTPRPFAHRKWKNTNSLWKRK